MIPSSRLSFATEQLLGQPRTHETLFQEQTNEIQILFLHLCVARVGYSHSSSVIFCQKASDPLTQAGVLKQA